MKQFSRTEFKVITVIFLLTVLVGCGASGSVITTDKQRPAIDPTKVKIYIEEPTLYETIGIVEASKDIYFSRQATQDAVIEKLKTLAAKVGANGVLLLNIGSQSSETTGFSSNGIVYISSGDELSIQGKAIYVIEE